MQQIFIATSDGYRESLNLHKFATDEAGLIALITEEAEQDGDEVTPGSFTIDYHTRTANFEYKSDKGRICKGVWEFFTLTNIHNPPPPPVFVAEVEYTGEDAPSNAILYAGTDEAEAIKKAKIYQYDLETGEVYHARTIVTKYIDGVKQPETLREWSRLARLK